MELKLSDLKQDKKNARKHTSRNIGMIEESLRAVGAARSGVIDENGTILAGNGTYEALTNVGIDKVKVVEADGNEWVVVKRSGLTEEQKRKLALADNRASDIAEWDAIALSELDIDLSPFFSEQELKDIGITVPDFNGLDGDSQSRLDQKKPVVCPACGHEFTT
jgi:ParB-like chromosome segregation protein Spo0J